MSDLGRNPEDRFSHNEAQVIFFCKSSIQNSVDAQADVHFCCSDRQKPGSENTDIKTGKLRMK